MPTKGKTKTRTSKSTKKGPKLKWWYILPVIAIVAMAGYAIVRYSEASSRRWSFGGNQIVSNKQTGTTKLRKSDGSTWVATPANIAIERNKVRTDRSVCADVHGPAGSIVTLTIYQTNVQDPNTRSSKGAINNSGNAYICMFPGQKTGNDLNNPAKKYVVRVEGKDTWVSRIYQNN